MTGPGVSERFIHRLRLEHLAVQVMTSFEASAVDVLLLKGPVTNAWLYGGADSRAFRDIDVLVRPSHHDAARALLRSAAFVDLHARMLPVHRPAHERTWQREGLLLDVHTRLAGIPAVHREAAFDLLWQQRRPFLLQGRTVAVLAEPARAVHLALHAAQSRDDERASRDLEHGLAELEPQVWARAVALAGGLRCSSAVAAGLRRVPAGREVADRFGEGARPTTEVLLRAHGASIEAQNLWEAASSRPIGSALRALHRLGGPPTEARVGLRTCVSATGRVGWAVLEIVRAAIGARRARGIPAQALAST